jgi:hypothetical protein
LSLAAGGSAQLSSNNKKKEDLNKKKEEEDLKKERKVIKMVVLNGIINFVLRAPDMLFWLENVSIWSIVFKNQIDGTYTTDQVVGGIFGFIPDIGYFTYILTFTTNFFIFYLFNMNFKEAVVYFWSRELFK